MTFQGDIYARYQCYRDADEFANAIRRSCPIKIDIGAVFNARPSEHKSVPTPLVPIERELVFDIDLTDYDNVRRCGCQQTRVCDLCFRFVQLAVAAVDSVLRNDFGFRHLLWVFSGRRGVHCWVCDARARQLSQVERSSVADYLAVEVLKNDELNMNTEVRWSDWNRPYKCDESARWSTLHPTMDRIYNEILLPQFQTEHFLETHVHFTDPVVQGWLLKDMPQDDQEMLKKEWAQDLSVLRKWEFFKAAAIDAMKKKKVSRVNPIIEIVFRYCYPRLDLNVSKGLNHLLKSPFVVHPSTGNVCVPFDPAEFKSFELGRVPTLAGIMSQLDAGVETDMDAAVRSFRKLFLEPLETATRHERIVKKQNEKPLDF